MPPPTTLTHQDIRTILIGLMLAMFLGALDQTIVATALPTIGVHFGDLAQLSWVVTAYLLTGTAVTPLYGKLSDVYGRRVMMMAAIGLFVVGSVACAVAQSMLWLISARALQGLGGGGLMALAQTIIADIVSPRERGRYQGYISAVFALSSVGGPVLGGVLTEALDWSLIFWINVPLGLGALGMTSNALKLVPYHPRKHRIDAVGALIMVFAAILLLLALSWGGRDYPWLSPRILTLLGASALLWVIFGWHLTRAEEPFLPLSVLGNKVVRRAALAGACTMGTLVGMTIYVPLYFDAHLQLSAGQSGVALIPLMAATVLWSTICGRLMMFLQHYKRVGLAGAVVAITGLVTLSVAAGMLPLWAVLLLLFAIGSGLGCIFPISTVCMQNAVARTQMGVATGAANFFRALMSALVVAVLGAIVLGRLGGEAGTAVETLAHSASPETVASAFRYVFVACAFVGACGLALLIAMEERPLRGPSSQPPVETGEPTPSADL
jgi:EmrB/QacA subfamily drug resistance transporter